jgi:DNA-binding transcriptional regulator YbjK
VPPVNQQRRDALADAAITIVAREGTHGLSHRSVDEVAQVPKGTTSNYFRSREALLEATVNRLVQRHFEWLKEVRTNTDPDRAALAGQVLEEAITVRKDLYSAMLELLLEGTRRPELRQALTATFGSAIELMKDVHRADGVEPNDEQVHLLRILYMGALFSYITQPETMRGFTPAQTAKAVLGAVLTRQGTQPAPRAV